MSNTITDLKDVRISQKALMPWMQTLLPLTAFSTNCSPDAADKGDTVKVPIIGDPSASSDFAGDYTQGIDSSAGSIPVTLSRHKFKTVHMTAREMSETAVPLLEKQVEAATQQLAQDVMADILSCVTQANFGAPVIPAITTDEFDYKTVLKVREACGKAKMPIPGRSLILDSSLYSALLADDIVAKSYVANLSRPGVVEGNIQRIAGFNMFETTCLPDNSENLAGMAVNADAIAVAMRYLQPVANYDEAGAVTDPTTGLTFGYLRYTDTKTNKVYVTVEALYGFTVLRSSALKRLVVTPAA